MVKSKESRVTIRFNEVEKEMLTEEANKLAMSLSQYVRYKALDEGIKEISLQKTPDEFFEKHISRMARLIVDGWVHIKAMSLNNLSEEQKQNAQNASAREIKKMGVAKWEEEYGRRTKKDEN